jgi:uncharacterized cupredoxin-like copper-binding protein
MMHFRHVAPRALGALLVLAAASCARPAPYVPRSRDITVTMVPLLVRETQSVYPFLKPDFAPGGVLEGKEVYAFSPSSITVVQGDTLHLHLVNPEDDVHTFMLSGLSLAIAGQSVLDTTYVARRAGIFKFVCDIPTHRPMMWGQLVVLPARVMAGVGAAAPTP